MNQLDGKKKTVKRKEGEKAVCSCKELRNLNVSFLFHSKWFKQDITYLLFTGISVSPQSSESFIDTHSAPPGYFWSCGGSAMLDATPDSPASCRSWPWEGAASSARWPPRCPMSDWLTGRWGWCPRRCGEEGGPQSDTVRPFGTTVLPPGWEVAGRRWGWLQWRGLSFIRRVVKLAETKLSTLLLLLAVAALEGELINTNLSFELKWESLIGWFVFCW